MRPKGPLRVLVVVLAASLLPVAAVSAHHGPTVEQVLAVAQNTWGELCTTSAAAATCVEPEGSNNPSRVAEITPASGPLTKVVTRVNAHTSGIHDFLIPDRDWSASIHGVGCADSKAEQAAVRNYMDDLAAKFAQSPTGGTLGPLDVGECSIVGSLVTAVTRIAYWEVTSTPLAGAFPTPTPTPSPTLKPKPTPTIRPTATAKPTATARATATGQATATATASQSGTASASATATATAAKTPEQTVLGFTFTPEPSSAPPAPAGGGGSGGDWAGSVASANEVSTDPLKLAGSGLAALLLLLAMGFIGELFNNTFEANYDRILAGWQKSWLGKVAKSFSGLWGGGR